MKAELEKLKQIAGAYKASGPNGEEEDNILDRLQDEGEMDIYQLLVDNEILIQRVENKLNLEVKDATEQSSSTVPELTDSVIESLYKQAQKQRKEFGAQAAKAGAVNKPTKRVANNPVNPHIPGNQKWQAIPNAKAAGSEARPKSSKSGQKSEARSETKSASK